LTNLNDIVFLLYSDHKYKYKYP